MWVTELGLNQNTVVAYSWLKLKRNDSLFLTLLSLYMHFAVQHIGHSFPLIKCGEVWEENKITAFMYFLLHKMWFTYDTNSHSHVICWPIWICQLGCNFVLWYIWWWNCRTELLLHPQKWKNAVYYKAGTVLSHHSSTPDTLHFPTHPQVLLRYITARYLWSSNGCHWYCALTYRGNSCIILTTWIWSVDDQLWISHCLIMHYNSVSILDQNNVVQKWPNPSSIWWDPGKLDKTVSN